VITLKGFGFFVPDLGAGVQHHVDIFVKIVLELIAQEPLVTENACINLNLRGNVDSSNYC